MTDTPKGLTTLWSECKFLRYRLRVTDSLTVAGVERAMDNALLDDGDGVGIVWGVPSGMVCRLRVRLGTPPLHACKAMVRAMRRQQVDVEQVSDGVWRQPRGA